MISNDFQHILNRISKINERTAGIWEVWMDDGKTLNLHVNKLHSHYDFDIAYKKAYGHISGIDSHNWNDFFHELCNKKDSLN